MSTSGATSGRKAAAEASRQRFLDVGVELLAETLGSPFQRVRAADIVARTPFTTGAFYHHWPNQDAYRVDLADYLGGVWHADDNIAGYRDRLRDASGPPAEEFRRLFAQEPDVVAADPAWWIEVAMAAGNEPRDIEALRTQRLEWVDAMAEYYGTVIASFGLHLADGVTIEWLTRSLMALVDGFSLQRRVGIGAEPVVADDVWSDSDLAAATLLTSALRREGETSLGTESVRERWALLFAIN